MRPAQRGKGPPHTEGGAERDRGGRAQVGLYIQIAQHRHMLLVLRLAARDLLHRRTPLALLHRLHLVVARDEVGPDAERAVHPHRAHPAHVVHAG